MNVRRQKDRRSGSMFPELILTGQISASTPKGRMEKRLPIIVVVRLVHEAAADTNGEERTYIDNLSSLGARVFSKRSWQPGDPVRIAPINEEPLLGEVVYCQHLPDDRYRLGVKFESGPVTWSVLERYDRS